MSHKQPKILFSLRDTAREIESAFQEYLIPSTPGFYFASSRRPVFQMTVPGRKQFGAKPPPMHVTQYRDGKPHFVPMYYQTINGNDVGLRCVSEIQGKVFDLDGEVVFSPAQSFLELSPEQKLACFSDRPRVPTVGYQIAKDFVDYQIDMSSMWVTRVVPLVDRLNAYFKVNTEKVLVEAVEGLEFDSGRRLYVGVVRNEVTREDPLGNWAEETLRMLMLPIQEHLQRFIYEDNWHIYTTRVVHDLLMVEKGEDYRIQQWEKEHGREYRLRRSGKL